MPALMLASYLPFLSANSNLKSFAGLWFLGGSLQSIKINPDRGPWLLAFSGPIQAPVYGQDEQPTHPRGSGRGSTLKWPPASLFAQLLGQARTGGNGIN